MGPLSQARIGIVAGLLALSCGGSGDDNRETPSTPSEAVQPGGTPGENVQQPSPSPETQPVWIPPGTFDCALGPGVKDAACGAAAPVFADAVNAAVDRVIAEQRDLFPDRDITERVRNEEAIHVAVARILQAQGWVTLSDVDVVLAVAVDDVARPAFALVHWLDADDMRARFDRALHTRRDAGHSVPLGRGIWIPLYIREDATPTHAGGGAGLDYPELCRVPLVGGETVRPMREVERPRDLEARPLARVGEPVEPLTIAEAKRRLAVALGVPEGNVRITVEG